MFRGYDFTYAGCSASMFGMYVADIGGKSHSANSFGNKANIVETRLAGRVTPVHFGVRYHDNPLSFSLIFGADRILDRYEMQEVSQWLMGYQEYQWLSIDQPDMEHIQFRCLVQELTPIHHVWLPMAFEAKIICDCPYGYSYPITKEFGLGKTVTWYNDSTCMEPLRPKVVLELAEGCTECAVVNETTGDELRFTGLPGGALTIDIDNENCVVTDPVGGTDLYEHFNFQFLRFAPGDNKLRLDGTGKMRIEGRYLYAVGA